MRTHIHTHTFTCMCVFIAIGNDRHPQNLHPRPQSCGNKFRSQGRFSAQSTQLQAQRPWECGVSCLWSWLWARFESTGPSRLIYSDDKIPKLYCLFICWQHLGNTISSEERPVPAEAGAQVGESWSHPLSLPTRCVVLGSYRWLLTHNTLSLSGPCGLQWLFSHIIVTVLWNWNEIQGTEAIWMVKSTPQI